VAYPDAVGTSHAAAQVVRIADGLFVVKSLHKTAEIPLPIAALGPYPADFRDNREM
jgi:hypothetical protein